MPTVNVPGVGALNFPDGMSQQDMAAAIEKNFPTQMRNARLQAQTAARVKDAQTATGFDKFAVPVGAALTDTGRALKSLFATAQGPGAGVAATAANEAQDQQEQPALDRFKQEHPHLYYGLYAPTSVLSMAPLGEGVGGAARAGVAALPEAASALPRALAGAAPKAAQGAAYGAQTPGDPTVNIPAGAALGPAADLVGQGIGMTLRAGGKALGPIMDFGTKVLRPDAAAQKTTQEIIAASRLGPDAAASGTTPGVALTQGGSSLDPGLQSLEQAVRNRVAGGSPNEAMFHALQRQNNSAVHQAVNGIEDATTPQAESSAAAHSALQSARDALGAQEKALWSQVPMNAKVDAANTAASIDGYINRQSVTNQRIIQRSAGDFLNDFKAAVSKYASEGEDGTRIKMPFGEIKDLRSTLGQAIRDAQKSGNDNAVRLLKGMDEKLLSSLGNENALLGAPEATGALGSAQAKLNKMNGVVTAQDLGDTYNAARGFTADLHGKYFPRDVQALLDKDPAKVLDAATATPEKLDAFLNATSQAPDKGAAAAQAVRKYLLNKAITSSSMSARGGTQPFINGQSLAKFLQNNRQVLSRVFSPQELQTLDAAAQNAYRNIATEDESPRLGSNTINNIFKSNSLSTQIVPGVGGHNTLVMKGADSLLNKPLRRYSNLTETYLRDAMLDPANNAKLFQAPVTKPSLIDLLNSRAANLPKPIRVLGKGGMIVGKASTDPRAALIRYLLQQQPQQ